MSDPFHEAVRLQKHAAEQGFDWHALEDLWPKLIEEIDELRQAATQSTDRAEDELGDLLFMVVNLARHLKVEPSQALRRSNEKFRRRFNHVLAHLDQLPPPGDPGRLEAMEAWWQDAKRLEHKDE